MADGFSVDRAALRGSAQRISDTIAALKGLGFDEEADVGRGFSGLALSGEQAGHAGLQQAFAGFCDRWSWGVRSLVQDGSQFAARLGISVGIYADAENYLTGVDDLLAGPQRFGLDPAGRVTRVTGSGWAERYAYDPSGNVTSAAWPVPPDPAAGPRRPASRRPASRPPTCSAATCRARASTPAP